MNLQHTKTFYILLFIAFSFSVYTTFFGLPQQIDIDERFFTHGTMMMLTNKGDPRWYGAPATLLMDMMALFYGIYFFILKVFAGVTKFWDFHYENYEDFLLIGRLICAAIYLAFLRSFLLLIQQRSSYLFSLSALIFLVFNVYLLEYGSIIRMDVLQLLCITLVIHNCLHVADGKGWKYYALSGFFLGLGVMSKYPTVVVCFVIIYAAFLDYKANGFFLEKVKLLFLSAFSSLAAGFLVAPYIFLNFTGVLNDVAREARTEHLSADGLSFTGNLIFYLTEAIPQIITWPLYVLTILSFLYFLLDREKNNLLKLLSVFFVVYLVFISSLALHWVRWALPLLIPLAVYFGYGVDKISKRGNISPKKSYLLLLIIFSYPLFLYVNYSYKINNDSHNMVSSYQWVYNNIPKQSKVAVESYTPQLNTSDYHVYIPNQDLGLEKLIQNNIRPSSLIGSFTASEFDLFETVLKEQQIDYLIISGYEGRFKNEADRYPRQVDFYNRMSANYTLQKEFDSGFGQKVKVYKVNQ